MTMIFGIPVQAFLGQLLVGLINGSFYAMLSLGPRDHLRPAARHQFRPWRAIYAGRLRRLSAAGGSRHRLLAGADPGAADRGLAGVVIERRCAVAALRSRSRSMACCSPSASPRCSKARSATITASAGSPTPCRRSWPAATISASCSCRTTAAGSSSLRSSSASAPGSLIEKTRLGSYLRAATENPTLVQAFGINVPAAADATYGLGAGSPALPASWRRRSTRSAR